MISSSVVTYKRACLGIMQYLSELSMKVFTHWKQFFQDEHFIVIYKLCQCCQQHMFEENGFITAMHLSSVSMKFASVRFCQCTSSNRQIVISSTLSFITSIEKHAGFVSGNAKLMRRKQETHELKLKIHDVWENGLERFVFVWFSAL